MLVQEHETDATEAWRDGVMTKMRASALTGARQLCIFEQWCEPGLGAPTHLHAVEEVLEVVSGQADVWVGDEVTSAGPNVSVLVPAGVLHGFKNTGEGILHVRATLAAPIFEASYENSTDLSRRYVP